MVKKNGIWGTAYRQWWAELATPDERPNWDCKTEEGRGYLERHRVAWRYIGWLFYKVSGAGPENL